MSKVQFSVDFSREKELFEVDMVPNDSLNIHVRRGSNESVEPSNGNSFLRRFSHLGWFGQHYLNVLFLVHN